MADEAVLRLLLRITARLSAVLFALAFCARPAQGVGKAPAIQWLGRNRNRFLLAFAGSHTVHLAIVISLAVVMGPRFIAEFKWIGVILGGLVYVFIYALAATALWPQRQFAVLSSARFQAIAQYIIWSIFTIAFLGGSFKNFGAYFPFSIVTLLALAFRIAGGRRATRAAGASAGDA